MRITAERYQKMVAAGVLTSEDRVELIEGEILDMAPIGAEHAAITARLTRLFNLAVGDAAVISPGGPLNLGKLSEPQPDVLVLKYRADFYSARIPEAPDALLLIEVSDSTLSFDRGVKRDLYAQFAILEYWVVDVAGQRVFTYSTPSQGVFQHVREHGLGEQLSPEALPSIRIDVQQLFA
jgi:Uma2 family endonuclease